MNNPVENVFKTSEKAILEVVFFIYLFLEVTISVLMALDKFFIEELQRSGYDITFLELRQIYSKSRMRNREVLEERRKEKNREYSREYWHAVAKHKRQKKGRDLNDKKE